MKKKEEFSIIMKIKVIVHHAQGVQTCFPIYHFIVFLIKRNNEL
jgi:hypothetical protein